MKLSLFISGVLAAIAISPVQANENFPVLFDSQIDSDGVARVSKRNLVKQKRSQHEQIAKNLLSQTPTDQSPILVTGVKINPTPNGIEVILESTDSDRLQVSPKNEANSFIAEIPNAQLRLTDKEQFRQEKPIAGIAEVTVTNINDNSIEVRITGESGVPEVELFDSDEGLIFGLTSSPSSFPPLQGGTGESEGGQEAQTPPATATEEIVPVTGVQLNPTNTGLELILQTPAGSAEQLQPNNVSEGKNFITDIPNTQLQLPDGKPFSSQKPIQGIDEVSVRNFDASTIRVTATGETAIPQVELFDSEAGLIFGFIPPLQGGTEGGIGKPEGDREVQTPTQTQSEIVLIDKIQLNPTDTGFEAILLTPTGEAQKLRVVNVSQGNNFIAEIQGAQLRSPDGKPYRQEKPIEGVSEVTITNQNENTVRVTVIGEEKQPTVELFDSEEGLIFSTQSEQGEEDIELVVTAEQDGYSVPDASTATRTDTPILNIPQSIQVIPEQVLDDQQVIQLDEALRNISGVTFGGTDLGRRLNFSLRGFEEAPILRNGFRQFGADVIPETANLDRVEVLKGPASVLYGEIEPGGLINLVTKKPTSEPFYDLQAQFGNRALIRPQIDLSGPLNSDRSLLYRLNALYQSNDAFQDVDIKSDRFYVSPVLTWKIGQSTDLTFELEYLNEERSPSFGIPAIGDRIADIPYDRIANEPDDIAKEEFVSVGYDFEHRFSDKWKLRNAFRFTQQNALLEVAYPFAIDEETGTVTRFWAAQPQEGESYSLQTNAVGKFATGAIEHELLFGVDLNLTKDNFNDKIRLDDSNPLELNLFDPVYETASRPDFDQLPLISDREIETRRLGIFIQDRVSFSDSLFLLAGLRYDTVEQTITNNPTDFEPISTETTQNNDALIPRIGIVYKPVEEVALYASYSQSFTPNPVTTSDGGALEPERGEGFEVGVKTELLQGRFSTTLAYFNITKQNVASEDPNDPFSFVATGEQHSQGVELDVTGEILPGWNIIASYAYIDAEVTEDNVIKIGNRLPNAPEHSASLWTTYEIQKGDLQGLGFGIGFNFVGEREGDLENSFELDSFFLTNAAIFYQRNNWRVALNFKNLFDVDYIAGTSTVRERGNDPGEPFTIIGSFSVRF